MLALRFIVSRYLSLSSGSGATLGAVRRYFMSPWPVALPARFLKNSAAVSTTPTFLAIATAIHWFKDTLCSFASIAPPSTDLRGFFEKSGDLGHSRNFGPLTYIP